MKQLVIACFMFIAIISGLLLPCLAEEGYWQRTGGPFCLKADSTNGGKPNCTMRRCTYNHVESIWREPSGSGQSANIEFHWYNPPNIIRPGEVVEITINYMRLSGWSSSSDEVAHFNVVMVQQGKETTKHVELLNLSVPLENGKGSSKNEVSNEDVMAPMDLKENIEIRFRLENFYELAYPYAWIAGKPPAKTGQLPTIKDGQPNCCMSMQQPVAERVYDIHVTAEPGSRVNAAKEKSINKPTDYKNDVGRFLQAIQMNQPEQVKLFLKAGMSPDATEHSCHTPLLTAIDRQDDEITALLINAGAKVNAKGCNGNTPILSAITRKNIDLVKTLINKGADLNARNDRDETPLIRAVAISSPEIIALLLKNGARVNETTYSGSTALMEAMYGCQSEIARMLLDAGANAKSQNNNGLTALMTAAEDGCEDISQWLLIAGSDINASNAFGATALIFSIMHKKEKIAQLLLSKGAAINSMDDEGITPFMFAIRSGSTDIALELIERGASVNIREPFLGRTPLMMAAFFGSSGVVQALLKKGVSVYEKDYEGWTALHWAVYNGNRYLLQRIIRQQNADTPYRNEQQYIIPVDENKRLEIVRQLISKGANVNAQTTVLGLTPLMLSAVGNNKEVVKLILDSSASLKATTRYYGLTAIELAQLGGNFSIITMLNKELQTKEPQIASTFDRKKLNLALLMEIVRKTPWSETQIDARFDDFSDGSIVDLLINPLVRELSKSKEGTSLLYQFVRNHPDIQSERITAYLSMDLDSVANDRSFWILVTAHLDKHLQTTATKAAKLPYEKRVEFLDIWLEWLNKVNPANIKYSYIPFPNQPEYFSNAAFVDATNALYGIYDSRIPPAYHRIFDSAANLKALRSAAAVLYAMGDPKSYSRLEKYITAIGIKNSAMLKIADEKHALLYAKKIGFPDKSFWNSFPHDRPDLARGFIRHVLTDEDIIKLINDRKRTDASSNIVFIIKSGSSALTDNEILNWLNKIDPERGPSFFFNTLIDIMGNRDTVPGNEDLLRIALRECNDYHDENKNCRNARDRAARALGKRLLGSKRNILMQTLQTLPDKEKARLAEYIIFAMPEIFPGSRKRYSNGFDNRYTTDFINLSKRDMLPAHINIEKDSYASLIRRYENKLLDWTAWTPSTIDISITYGFMKSPEAQRRFEGYHDRLSYAELEFSWIYRKYPSRALLQELLPSFKGKELYETMILLMLAESGDDTIYSMLKQQYYAKEIGTNDTPFFAELAEESARRQDYDALKSQSHYLISRLLTIKPKDSSKASQLMTILSKFLFPLIKSNAHKSLKLAESIDIHNSYYRESLIDACKKAQSPNCEGILKTIEPFYDSLKFKIKTDLKNYYAWSR